MELLRWYSGKLIVLLSVILLASCAQLPEATGETAQAISSASNAVQAAEVGKIVHQDINVPIWMVGILVLVAWCVRTPWGLISDFLAVRKMK